MRSFWLFCLSVSLWGQTLEVSHFQNGSTSLADRWKFHSGDDPRWADPNFDDSDWKLVQVPGSLGQQGYPRFSGYGWYRLRVQLDTALAAQDLQLLFDSEYAPYEVYANGNWIGGFGSFPPRERRYDPRPMSFAVPKIHRSDQTRLLIAFRFFTPSLFARSNAGGLAYGPIEIGTASVVQDRLAAKKHRQIPGRLLPVIVHSLMLVLTVILMAVYSFDRRPEYLWLGLGFTARAFSVATFWLGSDTFLFTAGQADLLFFLLGDLSFFVTVYGIWRLLVTPTRRSYSTLRWLFTLLSLNLILDLLTLWVDQQGSSSPTLTAIDDGISLCLYSMIVIFILRSSRIAAAQTRWLALSFVPFYLLGAFQNAQSFNQAFHLIPVLKGPLDSPPSYPLGNLTSLTTILAFGYFLLRRFGAARAEEERLHTELETARQVQLLMLPSQAVAIPNLRVETVYLPAQEVGGDFFQIAQTQDGALLLVIGDVSGKGLKAALTVSWLVGLWQEMMDGSEPSPREVLSRLNQQLRHLYLEGFVTCLCVRLSADGTLTLANAGHLAPYVNDQELVTSNGLPLGLSAEGQYSETKHTLAPEDILTLLSDGVVEARDQQRHLYGFDRLQQVLSEHPSAEALAYSAQQFGQEDDITVILISRHAVEMKPLLAAPTVTATG